MAGQPTLPTPDLFHALGMMYVTHILNRGDRGVSEAAMSAAMNSPAFAAAAQAKLAQLEGIDGDNICRRDFVSRAYRDFLRKYLTPAAV